MCAGEVECESPLPATLSHHRWIMLRPFCMMPRMKKIEPLAQNHIEILRSPDSRNVYCGSPGIGVLPSGRIVVTEGLRGPGLEDMNVDVPEADDAHIGTSDQSKPKSAQETRPVHKSRSVNPFQGRNILGKLLVSDDGGNSWKQTFEYRMMHQRPFVSGGSLYVIGHDGDLLIMRSDDEGDTWGAPVRLTDGEIWHQAPSNVTYANGCVYLVMEKRTSVDIDVWPPGEFAPVLMRGRIGDDLTKRESWAFASALSFRDVLPGVEIDPEIDFFGVPFFSAPYPHGSRVAETREDRHCAPIGWLETNVVQFVDPEHLWTDRSGRTMHLWMRAHTGGTGYASIARVVETGDRGGTGDMRTELVTAPSGKRMLFVPCPGGQMKFHVLYDEPGGLYWLLSTQATDSMRRPEIMPDERYNLPNNERRRLQLHFSKNMIDWCFAGLVCVGPTEVASRHYAAMAVRGDDLLVVSRSGSESAKSAHDTDISTFHRIEQFRNLVY